MGGASRVNDCLAIGGLAGEDDRPGWVGELKSGLSHRRHDDNAVALHVHHRGVAVP